MADPSESDAPATTLYEGPLSAAPLNFLGNVRIGKETVPFIINTGVTRPMVVDTAAAALFGPPIRQVELPGAIEGSIFHFPEARLGKIEFPAGEVTAIDMSIARAATGLPIAGVIGWKSLEGKTLAIDHDKKVLQIWQGKADLPNPVATLPVTQEGGIPHVTARMGTAEVSLAINTGADGLISLAPAEFDRLVNEGWIKTSSANSPQGTVGGIEWVKSGWFLKGTLFDVDLKGMGVVSSPDGVSSAGLTFLLKLNFTLSSSPSQFSYSLRKNPGIPISPNRMTGAILLYRGGRGVVARLKPGGQAEKAGLLMEDEVVSIDELDGKSINKANLHLVCRERAGRSLTLQILRQGKPRTITLELEEATSAWIDSQAAKVDEK